MLKTLKRKIALVAVAGLGAGLVSVAPAFAAGTLTVKTDSGGAGVGTTTSLYVGSPYVINVADTGVDAAATLTTVNHAVGPVVGVKAIGTITASTGFVASVTLNTAATTGNLVATYAQDGAVADTATLGAVTVSAAPVFTATVGAARALSGQTMNVSVTGTGAIEGDVVFKYASISKPALSTAPVLTDTAVDTNLTTATSATVVGTFLNADVAGTYTGVVYQDTNINGSVDPGEPSSYISFTTAGAPASITLTPATSSKAAAALDTFTVTLLDAAGNKTQAATGEFFSIVADPSSTASNLTIAGSGLASIVNPGGTAGANSTAVIPFTALGDGSEAFTVVSDTAGDTVAISVTPSGALVAQGVTAKTASYATVAGATLVGVAKATTSVRLVADATNTTTVLNIFKADSSLKTITFEITGIDANKAILYDITSTDGDSDSTFDANGNQTVNDVAYNSGADLSVVASATGTATIVWTTTGAFTAGGGDFIVLDLTAGSATLTSQVDAKITWSDPTYANTLAAPTSTTLLVTQAGTVTFTGKIADQFTNPLQGVALTLTGTQTGTVTVAALTASTTSASDGSWSLTLPAPAATTTSVSAVVTSVKTGITIAASSTFTVSYTATGNATTLTKVSNPAQVTATDLSVTSIPATLVPYDGVVTIGDVTGLSNASYTLATAATTAAGTSASVGLDEYFTIVPTSTPAAQVTFSSDDSVYFSVSAADVAWDAPTATTGKGTLVVANGATVKIWSTKAGTHTVKMAVGTTTTSQDFFTSTSPFAARNLAVTAPATLKQGEIGRLTVTATDNFGNVVKGVTAGVITAAVTGAGTLGGGKITDTFGATDAAGQALLAVVAGNSDGALSFTLSAAAVNNVPVQIGARAGRSANAAETTDGTITGLTASVGSPTAASTVAGAAAQTATDASVASVKTDVATANAAVKALATQVTVLQASVATLIDSLTTQIAALLQSVSALTKAVAKLQAAKKK